VPRAESLRLGAAIVSVDYLDERKFARAAAKARVGAETVDLTCRQAYVDDPSGQFQGYKDTNEERAWGLFEWAERARQGAYLDWLMANAILPAQDPNPLHEGIQKIDRTTVTEIGEIAAQADEIQGQLDKADRGLNPLGLGKSVVSFDIDSFFLDIGSGTQSRTHFDQIYERAETAMNNAMKAFNNANQLTTSLRRQQDSDTDYARNIQEQERDFKSRLIEILGYPYAGDIGPGKTYPSAYDGPDLYHYMYAKATELISATTGTSRSPTDFTLATREWKVLDQKIPPPFTLGKTTLQNPAYIPIHDSLSSVFGDVRKFSSLRAYHDSGEFDESEAATDTCLIGRSVWSTEWMLIIPGGTLLYNPDQGLNTFINSVGDIRIFFQSYSYSGN
jgi:hypothetical protein